MKRLLLVIPVYGSYRAFLKNLASWMIKRGWEVHLATNLAGAKVEPDATIIHQLDMPRGPHPYLILRAGRHLSALIKMVQPSVVYAHFSVGIFVLALASRLSGVRRLGTFQGMRFPLAAGFTRWAFKLIECFSILRLDRSWVLTADDYEAVPPLFRRKLSIQEGYGFGCDIEHFDPARFSVAENNQLRSQLVIPMEAFVFIFVGRMTAFKGFHLALSAFQKLNEVNQDVHFLVVGEPDPQHQMGLPDLNLLPGVHHVGWQEDPAPYLAIADSMVFPSRREGVPVCLMEALSMGVPVIGLNVRGVAALVEDGVNGFLCDPTVEALVDKMLRFDELKAMCPLKNPQFSREFFCQFVESSLA